MATCDIQIFFIQAPNPGDGMSTDLFILLEQVLRSRFFHPRLHRGVVTVDGKIIRRTFPTLPNSLEEFEKPALGCDEVRKHVSDRPRAAFGVDFLLPLNIGQSTKNGDEFFTFRSKFFSKLGDFGHASLLWKRDPKGPTGFLAYFSIDELQDGSLFIITRDH